jgi:hypothetical protein
MHNGEDARFTRPVSYLNMGGERGFVSENEGATSSTNRPECFSKKATLEMRKWPNSRGYRWMVKGTGKKLIEGSDTWIAKDPEARRTQSG